MAVDIGSRRVMEKVGMRLVRSIDIDWMTRVSGQDEGGVQYALTRDEWSSHRT